MNCIMNRGGRAPAGTLLLASGLSVLNANSFSRQLRLLKHSLERAFTGPSGEPGIEVILAGVATASGGGGGAAANSGIFDLPDFSAQTLDELVLKSGVRVSILLGYPDQFPFLLEDTAIPVYFWYQCSRPAVLPGIEKVTVVPLTAKTARHLENAGFGPTGPVIPHGVDTDVFAPEGRESGGGPVFLSVGANTYRKRFDVLVEAFARAKLSLPDARLIIKTDSGKKPGGFDLQHLLGCHDTSGAVSIIDREMSDAEMAGLYASSDIYVHTAEWEGFGIPAVEAMACGLPVVTHPVQGPGELVPYPDLLVSGSNVIQDGDVELLLGNPRAFADMMVRFAEDPELARFASIEGRRVALDRFDIRNIAGQWLQLLADDYDPRRPVS